MVSSGHLMEHGYYKSKSKLSLWDACRVYKDYKDYGVIVLVNVESRLGIKPIG